MGNEGHAFLLERDGDRVLSTTEGDYNLNDRGEFFAPQQGRFLR